MWTFCGRSQAWFFTPFPKVSQCETGHIGVVSSNPARAQDGFIGCRFAQKKDEKPAGGRGKSAFFMTFSLMRGGGGGTVKASKLPPAPNLCFIHRIHKESELMGQFFKEHLADIGTVATILSLLVTVAVLAFSALRYVTVRRDELRNLRYERYHELVRTISQGADLGGALKLVSQRAYIYELRHFPEYKALTTRLLQSLIDEWNTNDSRCNVVLDAEIKETIAALK